MTKGKIVIKAVKIVAIVVGAAIAGFGIFAGVLTLAEYKPAQLEPLEIKGAGTGIVKIGQPIKLLSWNIGYASLDATEDFVMDGGSHVRPLKDTNVKNNIPHIQQLADNSEWDAVLLQEVDTRSYRSFKVNQVEALTKNYRGTWVFAYNFKAIFVPFPFPPIGPVQSGLVTMHTFTPREAVRFSLPSPFSWPVRTANMKRCLLAEWFPIAGTDKELVLVNLHLEAYASESGRAAQMKLAVDFLNTEYAKGNYVIAGGDFNQSFPGIDPELFRIKNDKHFIPGTLTQDMLQPGWRFAADTKIPSSRLLSEPYSGTYEDTQLYVIDGFIISPNVRLESVKTLADGFKYSDHHPVSLEVTLAEQEAHTL